MYRHPVAFAALAVLAAALGCTDRPTTTAPAGHAVSPLSPPSPAAKPERLARAVALALRNPAFRAYVRAQLNASPFREHKVQFQRFLRANARCARSRRRPGKPRPTSPPRRTPPSRSSCTSPSRRRAASTGDEHFLVATAIADHEAPVAFDLQGDRQLLSPDQPPATPVLALVPVETDFSRAPSRMMCLDCGGGGSGGSSPPPPAPGLYMTQSHFTRTFEGWLKGSPEFEAHILGQKGASDSLTDYQCAGEHRPVPYYFDQNDLDWSGSVMLFSQAQLDAYKTAHPGQNVRVYVVEDDDTACEIKADPYRIQKAIAVVDSAYRTMTNGKDTTTSTVTRLWKFAKALQKLWSAVASLINTNDELVGNAVQDSVVGEYHTGFNWIVKGEDNVTNGWIKLVLR